LCVHFTSENFDQFLGQIIKGNRIWTNEELDRMEEKYVTDFGEGTETTSKDIDDIVYGN